MAESNFGIMELLQKLFKERGTGVSDKEMGIMTGKPAKGVGKGYESFIDKNTGEFKRTDPSYQAGEMQTLDPLANTTQVGNATTPALNKMRSLQQGEGVPNPLYGSNYYAGQGMQDMGYHPKTLGGVSDREQSMMQGMTQGFGGEVSNVDTMFAQALNALSPREQAEIIQTTKGYTDEQVENFKIQYLQGRVSSYELEQPYLQSNLGFQ